MRTYEEASKIERDAESEFYRKEKLVREHYQFHIDELAKKCETEVAGLKAERDAQQNLVKADLEYHRTENEKKREADRQAKLDARPQELKDVEVEITNIQAEIAHLNDDRLPEDHDTMIKLRAAEKELEIEIANGPQNGTEFVFVGQELKLDFVETRGIKFWAFPKTRKGQWTTHPQPYDCQKSPEIFGKIVTKSIAVLAAQTEFHKFRQAITISKRPFVKQKQDELLAARKRRIVIICGNVGDVRTAYHLKREGTQVKIKEIDFTRAGTGEILVVAMKKDGTEGARPVVIHDYDFIKPGERVW